MTDLKPGVLVVSPHPGVAVFGCGASLAGVTDARVCTLFAGPPTENVMTDEDTRSGFTSARDALAARIEEDDRALNLLNAASIRLNFVASRYAARRATRAEIAQSLQSVLRDFRPQVLMIPLGLFDADHVLAHQASCDAWLAQPELTCFAYEESFYRRERGLVQQRLIDLHARGIDATPMCATAAQPFDAERRHALKREAVSAYASRVASLGPDSFDDVFHSERYWKLELAARTVPAGPSAAS
nr:PIG-L family deacetylase [Caballeronia sp. BR00000012568055]